VAPEDHFLHRRTAPRLDDGALAADRVGTAGRDHDRGHAAGRGVGQALLGWAETRARQLGCCKLTLEVLSNNRRALRSYEQAGFEPYVLDPAAGQALFLQKKLTED
jgi:GNAT superfamily N-acetyltransferase